ncbi:hypothetical protein BBOV_III010920 [Babesia bovis T2Bo]|uniref:Uncharacterized protein n=1 Tax=Babesia bovis TaxID=5865 RepID=A7AQ10_BABBO|nr:hypothetical protein BBOV_III010920 [Babesia bovis T2Bo]EDO08644.1 hypothetical protein BBOV_III010920 [Babesia bovis T2Bo]|eukprot:XP_001612212.1 hypothetical protein [Babesia bovis T2Bo]
MKLTVATLGAVVALSGSIANGNLTARESLKAVDTADRVDEKFDEVVFEVSMSIKNAVNDALSFCAKIGTIIWFSDAEIKQSTNPAALFDIVKTKFGARAFDPILDKNFNTLHRLSALARLLCQGKILLIENNVQNETKNVTVVTELDSNFVTKDQLSKLDSSTTELSLFLNEGQCPLESDSESIDLGNDPEGDKFRDLAFSGLEVADNPPEDTANEPLIEPEKAQPLTEEGSTQSESTDEPTTESTTKPDETPEAEGSSAEFTLQTPEQESNFMNRIEQVDAQDHPGEDLKPIKITLKAHVTDAGDTEHLDVVTSATVLVTETTINNCQEEHLYKCIDAIRQKLFDRYEDVVSKDFMRGKFISLLQCLMLRNDVYASKVNTEAEIPEIDVFIPSYTTNMGNFPEWKKMFCNLESNNKRVTMDMSAATEPLRKREDSQIVALSHGYPVDKYEKEFIEGHPDLPLETPDDNKVSRKSEPVTTDTDSTPEQRKNVKPENHQDMQRVLSQYELALSQVPKEIHGYQLNFKDVEEYPNLQKIWRLGLTTMNLMKPEDELKDFLEKHTFTYDQLKELFNFAYGVIAIEQYEAAKAFYDSANIPKEALETGLTRVKNLFVSHTGTNITMLPPVVKQTAHMCPIKDMIISLSTDDLIDRIHVMIGTWLDGYQGEETPEGNFQLATLCSTAAILVQQWRYMQLSQGYREDGDAWILLMQSFSRMGQSPSETPEVREKYKSFINSNAAKVCRKYMNQAGIIAHSPYKGITRNIDPLSLTGAVGNVLDQNMEASPAEIITAMRDYFTMANKKNRVSNAMAVCLSMQMLTRMNSCLSVDNSNDYSLYKLALFSKDMSDVLDGFTSSNVHIDGNDRAQLPFIQMACDRRDSVVEETFEKLFKMLSTEGNTILIETLDARNYIHPEVDENGMIAQLPGNSEWDDNGFVPLEDVKSLQSSEEPDNALEPNTEKAESKPSFLELHGHSIDDVIPSNTSPEIDNINRLLHGDMDNASRNHRMSIYDKIMSGYNPYGIANPADVRTINFEFRMIPKFDDVDLKTMSVPLLFLKDESDYLRNLHVHDYPIVLMRKLEDRMDKMRLEVPVHDMFNHARAIANLENKKEVTLSLNKHMLEMNKRLNDYKQLLNIIKDLPHDGYYFEQADGMELPRHDIGKITADALVMGYTDPHTIVMQIIDPVMFVDDPSLFVG